MTQEQFALAHAALDATFGVSFVSLTSEAAELVCADLVDLAATEGVSLAFGSIILQQRLGSVDNLASYADCLVAGEKNRTKQATSRWADAFRREIAKELDYATRVKVDRENAKRRKAGDSSSCATHDYCDANVAMAAAFEEITGREFLWSAVDDEQQLAAWGAAWDLAIERGFSKRVPRG